MTAHTTGWSANRSAAKAVVLNATDVADARYLLEVCGLIDGPTGRAIVADDTRVVSMSLLTLPTGTRPAQTSSQRGDEDLADDETMTSPAQLRPAKTKKSRKKAAAKKKTAPVLTVVEPPTPDGVEAADELVRDLAADHGVAPKPAQPPAVPDGIDRCSAGAVELDVWFTTAQLSTSRSVQRAARTASAALLQLLTAMDDLARAERATTSRSTGETA